MERKIRILIVDDQAQTRESIKTMLQLGEGMEIAGEAADGAAAIEMARALRPDVVLMDINMPVLDGIAATQAITTEGTGRVVMISVQGEQEYLRRAMQAGARDYLVKPFSVDELTAAMRSAAADSGQGSTAASRPLTAGRGRVVTLFSTKGGVGKTTLATNLAVALGSRMRRKVGLLDFDLEFGCLSTMFALKPAHTIVDLCRVDGPLNADLLERVMLPAASNTVLVLPAPVSPEQAAEVDGEGRRQADRDYPGEILAAARERYEFTLVDTGCNFREATLSALDRADRILLVATPEIPTLHKTARSLDILLQRLGYPADKVRLVLNRNVGEAGLTREDVESSLDFPVWFAAPDDVATAVWGANSGQPFVLRKGRSPLADSLSDLAERLVADLGGGGSPEASPARSSQPALAATGTGARKRGLFA